MKVAARVLEAVSESKQTMSVVMLGSTEEGCGGYGRLVIDPWAAIEVRFFGWPMLVPGGDGERPDSSAAMRRLGFGFDGTDWVWRKSFLPQLVPVAAHVAVRAMAEAWMIGEGEADGLVQVYPLDLGEVALIASGLACERCAAGCTRHR